MTEVKAILVVFGVSMLLLSSTLLGLMAVGANEGVLALDFIVLLAATSYAISVVVMHYGASGRRRR
jgi:hypothetical protein